MYEKIHQMKFDDSPAGKFHYEKIKDFLVSDNKASALLGFIENCNHIHPKNDFQSSGFHLVAQPGKIFFKVPGSYKKGQEFNYQYQGHLTSFKTVYIYGFYYRENPYKYASLPLNLQRNHFTKQKFLIGKELGIIPDPDSLEGFFNQIEKVNLSFSIDIKNKEDMKFMKFLKLITFNSNHISIDDIKDRLRRLTDNKALDYNSEILSSAFLRSSIFLNIIKTPKTMRMVNFF